MRPHPLWLLPALALLWPLACSGPEAEPEGGAGAVASRLVPGPALAGALAASLEAEGGGPVPDDLLRRRVAELHAQVAAAARVERRSLAVLDASEVVLRALPGGHDQVSRGLLEALAPLEPAEGRACLAALLGRLCGLAARGAPEEAARAAGAGAGVASLPSAVRPLAEGEPGAAREAEQVAPACRALRAWRPDEEASLGADRLAFGALDALGLPREALPRAWATLERLLARDPARLASLIACHGPPAERAVAARALLTDLSPAPELGTRARDEDALDLTPLRAEAAQEARLDAADLLIRRAAGEEALRLLEGARGPRAAALRGAAQLALGKPLEAERSLRAALLLHPGCTPARLGLLRLYLEQGRRESAEAELAELRARAPLLPALLLLAAELAPPARARELLAAARALDAPEGAVALRAAARLDELTRAPEPPPPPDPARSRPLGGG